MSIEHSDAEAAAVAVAPRVTLSDIENAISFRLDTTAYRAAQDFLQSPLEPGMTPVSSRDQQQLRLLSLCILVMENGFTVVGKSAPASPENFDADLGKKFAYEDCIRQLWPLMGYELRERLHRG